MCSKSKLATRTLTLAAVAWCLSSTSSALAFDSFFDVFVDVVENGQLSYELQSPTPYDNSTVQTEMVSMSLTPSPGRPVEVTDIRTLGGSDFTVDSFFDIEYRIEYGGGSSYTVDSFFDVFVELSVQPPLSGTSEQETFPTEILSMDLTGASPGPDNNGTLLRLLDSAEHHGHVTVLKLSDPGPGGGGTFHVDSFFDVFTEISLDGNSYIPPESSNSLYGGATTPEPASALMLMFGSLVLATRRRRV